MAARVPHGDDRLGLASHLAARHIFLADLSTLPAFTIIGTGTYGMFATLDPGSIEMAVPVALFVPGAIFPQLFRLVSLSRTFTQRA